jgi:hypothetical protein
VSTRNPAWQLDNHWLASGLLRATPSMPWGPVKVRYHTSACFSATRRYFEGPTLVAFAPRYTPKGRIPNPPERMEVRWLPSRPRSGAGILPEACCGKGDSQDGGCETEDSDKITSRTRDEQVHPLVSEETAERDRVSQAVQQDQSILRTFA